MTFLTLHSANKNSVKMESLFLNDLNPFNFCFQVLKGDLQPAIETHEILYNVAKKYKFLPEVSRPNL